ncbi:MAG: hypothetical protein U9P38_05725 [Campylobacterota bacterium]|nr:hypothetical protein [Campylobacterota bacterium]
MELKDVILSTLAEMEDVPAIQESKEKFLEKKEVEIKKIEPPLREVVTKIEKNVKEEKSNYIVTETELVYLNSIRERLLVLFEGFQSPNNLHIESKVDMILNFLEYVLSTIEVRINSLEKENKQ